MKLVEQKTNAVGFGYGALVGVVHLLPLPGSPHPSPGLAAVLDRACADAETLVRGGFRFCIVENFGDAPFGKVVEPHVTAMMAVVTAELGRRFGGPGGLNIGVNVLRNDPLSALGVAASTGAGFVRINIHAGATWTDQGLIEGRARDTLVYRRRLWRDLYGPRDEQHANGGVDAGLVRVVADVDVKHGSSASGRDLEELTADVVGRGGADVVVVSGHATGHQTDLDDIRRIRGAVAKVPVWVGSGATCATIANLAKEADGVIIGTDLHQDGQIGKPLDLERAKGVVQEWNAVVAKL